MPPPPVGLAPFDPDALLAMLRAFYPIVSPANLARARAERPDYFAGGVITRANGDKIQLPDGRIYDCIINSGGRPGTTFWSCSLVDPNDTGVDDPFALEEGPLQYVDESLVIFSGGDPSNVDVVAGELGALDGADGVLDQAGQTVATFTGAAEVDAAYWNTVPPARDVHLSVLGAFHEIDPGDVIDATNSRDGEIDQAREDFTEPQPPDTPEPDPGEVPKDGDDGGGGGKEP